MKAAPFSTAAGMLLAPMALAANVIDKGTGFGTYYYDLEDPNACFNDFHNMDGGYVECSLSPLTLNQIGSNNLVAMDHLKLAANPSKYCGKQVVVSVNGVASNIPFFIGDGCERCALGSVGQSTWNAIGAPGLDFSFSQLDALSSKACNDGHIDISWEILDTTIYDFANQKFVQGKAPSAPQTTAAQTSTASSASKTSSPATVKTSVQTSAQTAIHTVSQSLNQTVSRTTVPTTLQTAVQTTAPVGGCGLPVA